MARRSMGGAISDEPVEPKDDGNDELLENKR
jgi:hypothetical protein